MAVSLLSHLDHQHCRGAWAQRSGRLLQDAIEFKGVVFNEMKGVYSQPDSVNSTVTQQALFPDNSYSVDSGGNPTVIPDLTFEEFQV